MIMSILCMILLMPIAVASSPAPQDQIFHHIDAHQEQYIKTLKEWVAIKSDSSDPSKRQLLIHMMHVAKEKIIKMGGSVEMAELAAQELPNGQKIPSPPVILAKIGSDPKKPTVCFYGHLDVQPAKKEDGWTTEPYTLVEKNGNLYGRGASDDKGQVLAVLHAIETAQVNGLPVNVKVMLEGMEEVGSKGLHKLVKEKADTFLADVDYYVVTDTSWISNTPGINYGTRGNCYFALEVEGARRDLHSGGFGGTVHEAMSDLIYMLGSLVDSKGHILVPGIDDAVAPLREEEKQLYANLTFDLEAYKTDIGTNTLLHEKKEDVLMHRWRYPSLSIHGIEGAYSGSGTKTVIPAKVIGKFSMRQVHNMEPSVVEKQVTDYLLKKFAERNSPNKMKVIMVSGSKPWLSDVKQPQYLAAQHAISRVFNVDADMIRAGGSIPIAQIFQEVTGKSVMLLGIGRPDDATHAQNEKISRHNYINGTKLYAVFLHELASI